MKCEQAIERIHQVLDGDLMEAAKLEELENHLSICAECRRAESELSVIQRALNDLPPDALPDDALGEVWSRTTESRGWGVYRWRSVAAAAVLALALFGLWRIVGIGESQPTQAELERGAEEVRLVLGLTAQALHKTERAAVESVLTEEVSPALKSVPIKWPGAESGRRKNHDEV